MKHFHIQYSVQLVMYSSLVCTKRTIHCTSDKVLCSNLYVHCSYTVASPLVALLGTCRVRGTLLRNLGGYVKNFCVSVQN